MPDRQTRPVFARADGKLVATALQEPSLTLFKSHHVFGYFVAHGCQEDSFTGRLQFEAVVGWVQDREQQLRPLAEHRVTVGMEEGEWAARSSTGELIISTCAAPFVVLFITPEDYRRLIDLVKWAMTGAAITHIARLFWKIPPQTRILLPRWSGRASDPTVRISLPPKSKETARVGLPPKPKQSVTGDAGLGEN